MKNGFLKIVTEIRVKHLQVMIKTRMKSEFVTVRESVGYKTA